MEISKSLELFSNDGLTYAERVEFSKWKVNRQKVDNLCQGSVFLQSCDKTQ